MPSRLIAACATAALIGGSLGSGRAHAATLTPTFDGRALVATTSQCLIGGSCTQFSSVTLPPTPFGDFNDSLSAAGATATEHSTLSSTEFDATGSVTVMPAPPPGSFSLWTSQSISAFEVRFLLDQAALVTFSGDLSFAASAPGSADLKASLCTGDCSSGSPLFATEISTALGDPTRAFLFSQVLPAGEYTVRASAGGAGGGTSGGSGSLSYTAQFVVPEPSVLVLVCELFALVALSLPSTRRS